MIRRIFLFAVLSLLATGCLAGELELESDGEAVYDGTVNELYDEGTQGIHANQPAVGEQDLLAPSSDNAATLSLPPEKPFVQLEFVRCSGTLSEYGATWYAGGSTAVTEWDVDIAYSGGSTWYIWYNGTKVSKLLSFDGGSRRIRVRGINSAGPGEFAYTGWVHDICTGGGGGDPQPL